MSTVKALSQARGTFNALSEEFKGANIGPGFLRADVSLVNGQNQYIFPILRDNNAQSGLVLEQLQTNDMFLATKMAIGILADDTAAPGAHIPFFYPNKKEFTVGSITAANTGNLETVFNGKLKVTVGDKVYIQSLNTSRFRRVNTAQLDDTRQDETSFDRYMVAITPNIKLFGNQKVEFQLTIPSAAGVQNTDGATANRIIKAVLIVDGFLVQNGSRIAASSM